MEIVAQNNDFIKNKIQKLQNDIFPKNVAQNKDPNKNYIQTIIRSKTQTTF